MVGGRRVMQEALFYGFGLERHVADTWARPAILSAPWASDNRRDWLGLASQIIAPTPAVGRGKGL